MRSTSEAPLIESRARTLVEVAVGERAPWARRLGDPPQDPTQRERWLRSAASVAAYRDRYKIVSDLPLAGSTANDAQRADRQRAQAALREAVALSSVAAVSPAPSKPNSGPCRVHSPERASVLHSRRFPARRQDRLRRTTEGDPRQKGDPMIMLLALPVIAAVALAHRYLLLYAPSNILIRRVRAKAPALSTAAAMLAVASSLIVALKVVSDAVAAGGARLAEPRRTRPRLGRHQGGAGGGEHAAALGSHCHRAEAPPRSGRRRVPAARAPKPELQPIQPGRAARRCRRPVPGCV